MAREFLLRDSSLKNSDNRNSAELQKKESVGHKHLLIRKHDFLSNKQKPVNDDLQAFIFNKKPPYPRV